MRIVAAFLAVLLGVVGLVVFFLASPTMEPEPVVHEPDTTDADISAIRDIVQELDEAWSAGDVERAMAQYADDAVEMPANEPALFGKPAIRSRTANSAEAYNDELTSTVEDVQISGDLGFARVSYAESWTPKAGGETTSVVGKSIFVCRRQQDGSWKIGALIWNYDAALEQ